MYEYDHTTSIDYDNSRIWTQQHYVAAGLSIEEPLSQHDINALLIMKKKQNTNLNN